MADATVALTVNPYPKGEDNTQRRYIVYGTAVITANAGTAPATGLPLDFTTMADGNLNNTKPFLLQVGPTQTKPSFAEFVTAGDGATPKQLYTYDTTNNSLIVWSGGSPNTLTVAADTINFKAEFIRGEY